MGPLPNFLLIGAAKSGTSSIYTYLREHPDVFMSARKEPRFFAFEGEKPTLNQPQGHLRLGRYVTGFEEYLKLFDGVDAERAIGEASTAYLYEPSAPLGIKKYVPDARLIAVLRHPADRAFSHFLHNRKRGIEFVDNFEEALRLEEGRKHQGWEYVYHYTGYGRYAEHLERYLKHFPPEQIKVFLYDELVRDPRNLMADIYGVIGVDPTFVPDTAVRANPSGVPRSRAIQDLLTGDNIIRRAARRVAPRFGRRLVSPLKRHNLVKPKLDPELRRELTDHFLPDIRRLEGMFDLDLTAWNVPDRTGT